ncbi:MAG: hypothetical protein V4739_16640 [Pseudomonadota bacterium]
MVYTGMGWLAYVIWLAALCLSSQLVQAPLAWQGLEVSRVGAIFLLAAALSAPTIFIAGTVLNRHKVARKIFRFGKERTVHWGPHTLNLMPIEYWAFLIPAFTLVFYGVFTWI